MIRVNYKPTFIRQYQALERDLQEEVKEKIELFKNPQNHQRLKVHKLKGKLADRYSFSVNYSYRIVFMWQSNKEAIMLAVGDHKVYR